MDRFSLLLLLLLAWHQAIVISAQTTAPAPTGQSTATPTVPDLTSLLGFTITTNDLIYAGAGVLAIIIIIVCVSCACSVGITQLCTACGNGCASCLEKASNGYHLTRMTDTASTSV
jgi:hypothetical protein